MFRKHFGLVIAGLCAGAINGLFGAGGGMVLIPLLSLLSPLDEQSIFPSSVCIILPICIVSILATHGTETLLTAAFPYIIASILGGILAGIWGKKFPTTWLHKILGIFILWGGVRYIC